MDERSGHVFVTNATDDSVSMLDVRRSTVLRTIRVGPSPLAVAVNAPLHHAFVLNGGWWLNAHTPGQSTVSLLDTHSGAILHTAVVGKGATAIALDERRGYVVVANSGDATTSVLDARTGTVVRTVPVGPHPGALTVDTRRGHVFVANDVDRSVSMVEARSGRVLRTIDVDLNPHGIAVDQHTDRIFVSMGEGLWPSATPGRVQVLDGRTGRWLRTVAARLGPTALAVEERSGHVFVANGYGTPAGEGGMSRLVAWTRQWLPAWGQQWLARLAQSPPPLRTPLGTVTVRDPSRL